MAERGGFEPPVPLLGVHTISSRAPSTARSPLRSRLPRPIQHHWDAAFVRGHSCRQMAGVHLVAPTDQTNGRFISCRWNYHNVAKFSRNTPSAPPRSLSLDVHFWLQRVNQFYTWDILPILKKYPLNTLSQLTIFYPNRTSSQTRLPAVRAIYIFIFQHRWKYSVLKKARVAPCLLNSFVENIRGQ